MNQHFSEADLLETYYTQPGESMPVMMHLAECGDCAARYERLERKIRGLAACDHDEKPETFWARQRISILRKVEKQPKAPAVARITRVAAAAAFVLVLGGSVLTWQRTSEVAPAPIVTMTTASATQSQQPATTTEIVSVPADPWDSEELDEFGSLVAWESWEETSAKGGQS